MNVQHHSLKRIKKITGMIAASTVLSMTSFSAAFANTSGSQIETRSSFLVTVLETLGVTPDARGISPYSDVSTQSTAWGYIHTAVESGMVTPIRSTYFGADALVNEAWVTQLAITELHIKPSSHWTLRSFAELTGLFADYQPTSLVTAAQTAVITAKLSAYLSGKVKLPTPGTSGASSGSSGTGSSSSGGGSTGTGSTGTTGGLLPHIPAGWHINQAQLKLLQSAISNSDHAPYEQSSVNRLSQVLFNLSKAGQKDSSIKSELSQQNRTFQQTISLQSENLPHLKRLYLTIHVPANATISGQAQIIQFYTTDKIAYLNQGQGWKASPSSTNSLLASVGSSIQTITNFSSLSATSAGQSTTFVGSLMNAKMSTLFNSLLTEAIGNITISAAQKQAMFAGSTFQTAMTVSPINGIPVIVKETEWFNIPIPASVVFAQADPTSRSLLIKDVANVGYKVTATISDSYKTITVPVPKGLPK